MTALPQRHESSPPWLLPFGAATRHLNSYRPRRTPGFLPRLISSRQQNEHKLTFSLRYSSPRLEQPDDFAVVGEIDPLGRRHLGQSRHGHDIAADHHDELG